MERIVASKEVKSPTLGLPAIWSNALPPSCSHSTIVSVAFP
jgi:hypothetical protein